MEMSENQFARLLTAVRESNLPDAPKGPTAEAIAAAKKRAEIKAAAFKSKRFAYYIVGHQGAYRQGRLYQKGEVILLPHGEDPSVTFKPATEQGVMVAERVVAKRKAEEAELAGLAKDDEGLDTDELLADANKAAPDEPEGDESEAEPEEKPAKVAKAKPAKKPGKGRASDKDVA